MSNEQERVQLEHATRRYASSQGARDMALLSVIDLAAPQDLGAHYVIAIKARWPSSGAQSQLRAFVATQDQSKQWWFLGLPEQWLSAIAEEVARTRTVSEAKP
jgi:hypothetical protein